MKAINVVGAVIQNEQGEILCALRSSTMSMPNLWEFPGGKIKEGEAPEEALVREIQEELGCRLQVGELVANIVHEYPTIKVRLLTYHAKIIEGEPKALEHAELRWVSKDHLTSIEWAPADLPTVARVVE
ncbi:8-oxo-dGTP diphosphatase MutT [Anaerobacillus alkaliphilus]|uniref:8-oxo-dGTP diphosphatase n=1 Tax=Anaerobacillus alkaliphilus TaxID=1548597 RepID=A0A4Q0VVG6_9BACI|nr:8-oxo-dGTP diphosphatase MutT [Anaerobacillus alkaliphilus]RXJ02767.1 8-oxo-dGTP diphosphatase MutT [Anaerobacillus alkaliphilus]